MRSTQSKIQNPKSKIANRGAAMSEMVLALPFILLIIAFVVYFGRGMVRVQHAQIVDRYEAWRQVARAPGPGSDEANGNPQINQAFFNSKADDVHYEVGHWFPDDAPDALLRAADAFEAQTQQLMQEMFDHNERGWAVHFSTSYNESVPAYQRFAGPIHHRHVRLGHDWRCVVSWPYNDRAASRSLEVSNFNEVRNVFFMDFDNQVASMDSNSLARELRQLYMRNPGYHGPFIQD